MPPPLLLLLSSVLSLCPSAAPRCHRARGAACAAPHVPGASILGWGLDVTTLAPATGRVLDVDDDDDITDDVTCVLCPNPLVGGRRFRLPRGVGGWRAGRRCQQGTLVLRGAGALAGVAGGRAGVAVGWRVGLEGARGSVGVAGSRSRAAEFALGRWREDAVAFVRMRAQCTLYWTSVSPRARPSPHFLHALRSLPPNFTAATAADYAALIAAYGTHSIRGARLGGRLDAVTSIRTCRAAMTGSSLQEVADCLGAEVSAAGRSAAMVTACHRARATNDANATFHELYAERLVEVDGGRQDGDLLYGDPNAFPTWLRGLPTHPGLVGADVRPLHTVLAPRDPHRAALRAAVIDYIARNALRVNCSCGGHLGAAGPCCACSADMATTCCSQHRGLARLRVTVKAGGGWRGDYLSGTDAYVRVYYGGREARTRTLWNNQHPRWAAILDLGTVTLAPGAMLKVEVWDEDNQWDDDLLGVCKEPLSAEGGGERDVICFPGGGRLEFGYGVTCGPALGGPYCHDYVPQPPGDIGGVQGTSYWSNDPRNDPHNDPHNDQDGSGNPLPSAPWWPPGVNESGGDPQVPRDDGDMGDPTDAFGELPETFMGPWERHPDP
ncbi:perforin-1 [Columba livia]|uniref:perforin-1 n=1 Tax=Columba livia TaxID=8932 RepID=UPI0031B9B759